MERWLTNQAKQGRNLEYEHHLEKENHEFAKLIARV